MNRPSNAAGDDLSIVAFVIVAAVFVWLLWPRDSYDDIAPRVPDSSYEIPSAAPDSSYVWPLVERTITTTVVVHPEDMP